MSSLVHYILFSFLLSHLFWKILLFLSIVSFQLSAFHKGNTLFSLVWWEHNLSLYGQKHLCLCSLQFKSLLWILDCFKKNIFIFFFCNLCWKKKTRGSLWKKLFFSSWFTSLFAHSCLFCGRSDDMDIGHGSSVAASRLISFLVSSFSCFQCFLFFTLVFLFVFSFCFSFFVPFCKTCFSLTLFCFICLFSQLFSSLLSYNSSYSSSSCSSSSCSSSSCLISSCFSVFLWTLPLSTSFSFKYFLNSFVKTCYSFCLSLVSFFWFSSFFCPFSLVCSPFFLLCTCLLWTSIFQNHLL